MSISILQRFGCAVGLAVGVWATAVHAAPYADPNTSATVDYGFFDVKGYDPTAMVSGPSVQPLVSGGSLRVAAYEGGVFVPIGTSATQELAGILFQQITGVVLELVMSTGSANNGQFFQQAYDRSVVTDPASAPGTETGGFVFTITETTDVTFGMSNGATTLDMLFDIAVSDAAGFFDTVAGTMNLHAASTISEVMNDFGQMVPSQDLDYSLSIAVPGPTVSAPAVLPMMAAGFAGLGVIVCRRKVLPS
ncbi:MAG: hypothetical protein KDC18_04360 [Alphaproteobacteria bacterium]|nr:hypothetical protein [Alphaproteobacteria bacterium]MCB9931336.1 hypothetical protein [Alphaproteobacteria bacterium]